MHQLSPKAKNISIHALLAESDRRHRGNDSRPVHFYPRSPCGERPDTSKTVCSVISISIHALLAESDWWLRCWQLAARDISIHALLAESDSAPSVTPTASRNFYPRSPCGERQRGERHANSQKEFLSTLSLRRATHQ